MLMATPLSEEKVLALYDEIKQSEYAEVIALWNNEIKLKSQSRSSGRKSIWNTNKDFINKRDNSIFHTNQDLTPQIDTPICDGVQ